MTPLTTDDLLRSLPILLPAIGALCCLLISGFRPSDRAIAPVVLAVACLSALGFIVWQLNTPAPGRVLMNMIAIDGFSLFFASLILALVTGAAAIAIASWRSRDFAHGEFWALLLFAACGMLLLAAATNLLLVFLGVELMSLSVYALVASDRTRTRPTEAALKYFLLGSFSSAFLLFGIAFIYGATGSFDLAVIAEKLRGGLTGQRAEMMLGTAFLLAGFCFKTAAAPFHMWAPDAYTGAPTPVTAFMASAVKAASFAAFIRIFIATLVPSAWFWSDPLAVIAGLTVVLGNAGALAQTEVKRLFAYSSIAHAGYLLIGLRAASVDPELATPAILFYLFAYGFTTLGAFGVVAAAERMMGKDLVLEDMAGFAKRHPLYAAALTIFLLALAGVPPTAGFTAKLYVFAAAVKVGDYLLAVIGVLASAVSLYYYLRVVVLMYMREPAPGSSASDIPARAPSLQAVVAVAAIVVLLAGVAPQAYFTSAQGAAASMSMSAPALTKRFDVPPPNPLSP